MINEKYGKLTILERINYIDKNGRKRAKAKCRCDCGNEKIVSWWHVKNGNTSSCGCLRRTKFVGQKYGKLTILEIIRGSYDSGKRVEPKAKCKCDCGIVKMCLLNNLGKNTFSCGCWKREIARFTMLKHGLSNHPLYRLWRNINKRCYNKNMTGYLNYGGRGVSNFWKDDVVDFITYVETTLGSKPTKKHSIDRIDNDGNYEPGNIRWATYKEQCQNKTHAHQRRIEQLEERIRYLEAKLKKRCNV